jgi:Zn-dependent M28 family amino/carboxypeptidase
MKTTTNISFRLSIIFIIFPIVFFYSCSDFKNAEETINVLDVERIVKEFSSDDFQGRKPLTLGEEKAVDYLINEYKRIGLEPFQNGSFIQEVPLVEIKNTISERMKINMWNASIEFKYLDDFIANSDLLVEETKIRNSSMVFVGYGIVAPEYNWNDYKDVNVKGKIAVVLINDPGFGSEDSTFFKGNEMTYYGRWTYKFEEAERQGAKGIIIIHERETAGYPWSVIANGADQSRLYLDSDNNEPKLTLKAWMTGNAAKELFSMAGFNYNDLKEKSRTTEFKPINIRARLNLKIKSTYKKGISKNVIGLIPGTKKADEVIVYSSHWDHLGIGPIVNGDSIYNGAVDNSTSMAWMLEIAEAFVNLKKKPARSIMFLSTTSEEQGLLGSEYYLQNPAFSLNKTVANINNDLMLPFGPYKDITITGYGQSELDDYVLKFAKEYDRYVLPDPNPQRGMYFRGDQFSFAKYGVPALYAKGSCDNIEFGKEWGLKKENDWLSNNYHKQTDQYDSGTWNLEGIVDDAKFLFRMGYELSNSNDFPKWKEGSEFKR